MRKIFAVVLVCGMFAGMGLGQSAVGADAGDASANASTGAKRPMTFADLEAMKRVSDPQISPSGKWVMFSVADVSLGKNIKVNHLWVVPITRDSGVPAADARLYDMGRTTGERQMTFGDGEANGRFSPDGKWISLSMKDQIYLAPWNEEQGKIGTGDSVKFLRVTNVAGGADGAIWAPDSKRLMFVASVYPECSDKAAWAEEDACDKAKDDAAAASPVKAQIWDHLLYRHWDHYTGEKRSHMLVVDVDGKNVRDLTPRSAVGDAETPTFSLGGPLGYAWAPDSKEVAYVTNLDAVPAASTNNDVFTLRLDEPEAKAVKISTSPGSDDAPAYSPDGKYLAFRSQARAGFESDRFRLMLYDRAGKTIKEIIPRYTNQKGEATRDLWVDEFVWSPDSSRIAYASGDRGEEPLFVIPINSEPNASWEISRGEYSDIHFTPDGKTIVASRMTVDHPTEIVAIQHTVESEKDYDIVTSNTDARNLTDLNGRVISQLDLRKMESFWFKATDGTDVQGFIIRPPGFEEGKKYPVKFLMHGGPQTAWGDAWSYRWNPELFAANGYVVVMINRRGSTGYGQKFIDQVSGDWGGKAYTDLMRGLDYAEAHYPFIDKTRECALGASYGGYMANWVLTHTNRFKCIVSHDGMYDPQSAYGTTEELWFNEWEFRATDEKRGLVEEKRPGQPWDYFDKPADADPFRKFSPMRFIKNAKTPTLIIHSQLDYRLDVSQGLEMFTALQRLGVPSKMLYFPDEGHWVLKPQNSQLWYETVNDWCDQWTHSGKYADAADSTAAKK